MLNFEKCYFTVPAALKILNLPDHVNELEFFGEIQIIQTRDNLFLSEDIEHKEQLEQF